MRDAPGTVVPCVDAQHGSDRMVQVKALSGRQLIRPKALLLDFGGVIVQTTPISGWDMKLALHVRPLLGASAQLDTESIAADIRAGCVADSHWKNAMSRPLSPRGDFVAADWPAWARSIVIKEAHALCCLMGRLRSHRELRDGMLALLDAADVAVPVAQLSRNCGLYGRCGFDRHHAGKGCRILDQRRLGRGCAGGVRTFPEEPLSP